MRRISLAALLLVLAMLTGACQSESVEEGSGGTAETGVTTGGTETAASGDSEDASSGEPQPGGTLVVAHQEDPAEGLDPHTTLGFPAHRGFELVYNSLVRYDHDLQVVPDLAESWDTPDPTTYVFHLRPGVKFHNGRELTAEDVKYSFERVTDPDLAAPYATLYEPITSIEVIDEVTVQFNLEHPFPALLDNMAALRASAIVPREVVEEQGDLSSVAVGTGPFILTSYVPEQELIYERNPEYFREGLPYLDGIEYRIMPDESTRLAAIRSGEVDFAALGPDTAVRLEGDEEFRIIEVQNFELHQLIMNAARPPFDDPRVREAIHLAIDRQELLDGVANGRGLLTGPIPTGLNYSIPVEELPYQVDLDRARELLAEAGYPDGFDVTISTSSLRQEWATFAIIIQANLAEIGINTNIDISEWGVFVSDIFGEANYDLMVITATIQEPSQYTYDYFHSESARNRAEFYTSELDEFAELTRVADNEETRAQAFRDIQMALMKDGPVVYSYTPYEYVATSPAVKDFVPIGSWRRHALEVTWLDQ